MYHGASKGGDQPLRAGHPNPSSPKARWHPHTRWAVLQGSSLELRGPESYEGLSIHSCRAL